MAADTLSSLEGLQDGTLSPHRITKLHNDFEGNSVYRMAQNAVCKIAVDDIALDRQIVTNSDFTFSHVLDDWSVTNQKSSGIGKTFTVECLGNVEGGAIVKYLNIDIDLMKQIAMKTIMDGEPVWMGCDVGKMMQTDLGLWDAKLYDYEGVYDTPFTLDKAGRLQYHQTLMTHAMLFTGVDVVQENGREIPRRWRVENSWGADSGRKGFYLMNDNWFDQYMFEIAARKEYLPDELQAALETEPIVLPAWDPMGALAKDVFV